jgi:tetratricopeptide (TPR) repeat protein
MPGNAAPGASADRFEIQGRLGAGGVGEVYRAFDRRQRSEVALKVLRTISARALYRFKREFRALADIVHPNLVTLHELHTSSDEWFFTMELVEGVPFIDWVRPRGGALPPTVDSDAATRTVVPERVEVTMAPDEETQDALPAMLLSRREMIAASLLDETRLRAALAQLVDAVLALHAAGKLHRDLKPSNVLVARDGRVVVLDFGLIADVSADQIDRTHEQGTVGTPAYMSPEQAGDRPLTEASDWYSVGVMLFEALTGRRPFEGTPAEVLVDKQKHAPPRVRDLAPEVALDLASLCERLIARDPAERPEGREILAMLGVEPSRATEELGRIAARGAFVGRRAEMEALEQALRDSHRRGVTVFVTGESGMGKSQLVRHVLDAHADDLVVLEGRCYERESVPFKALDTVIDALSAVLLRLPEPRLAEVMPRDIAALARLFPVLRRVPAVANRCLVATLPPDPQELRRRAFGALRYALRQLARFHTIVIWIDDLQWGDADSAVFLADLVHMTEPLLLLFTHRREDDAGVVASIRDRPAVATGTGDLRAIDVGPLAEREARELIRAIAGPDVDAAAIVREAGGHPLFIAEMARSQGEASGRSLSALLAARIAALPPAAAALLRACAVEARPLRIEHAIRATGLDALGPEIALLRAEHLIRLRMLGDDDAARLEPYHDRVREVAVGSLGAEELRAMHRALAETFEAELPDDRLLDALVEHWLAAGEFVRAANLAVQAARVAEEALAFRRAADLYQIALDHGGHSRSERSDLLRRRGDALANAGQLERAAEAYGAAATGAPADKQLELERLRLEQLLRRGRLEEGLELARAVLRHVDYDLPHGRSAAVRRIIRQRIGLRLRGLRAKERTIESVPARELQRADVLYSVSSGLAFVDPLIGRVVQNDFLRAALDIGEPYRISVAFCQELGYLGQIGHKARDRADKLEARLRDLNAEVQHPYLDGLMLTASGLRRFLIGEWREARRVFQNGASVLRDRGVGVRWEVDLTEIFLMSSLFYLGETAELVRMVPILLREAVERGDLFAQHGLRGWRSNVTWLLRDEPRQARAHVTAVEAQRAETADFHLHHYYSLLAHTQIDLYEGDVAAALRRVEAAQEPMARSHVGRVQSVRIESAYLRARAALAVAARANDPARAPELTIARKCARALRGEKVGWAVAMSAMVDAAVSQIVGEPRAPKLLDAAATMLEAGDMSLHAAIVRLRRAETLRDQPAADEIVANLRAQSVADPLAFAAMLLPSRPR